MKAVTCRRYGGPEVLRIEDLPRKDPAADEVEIRVMAAPVTTADWRMRASAFPAGLWLIGRLVSGLFAPRKLVPGVAFAGVIARTGDNAGRFTPGDRVFGFSGHGSYGEYLTMPETGALAATPDAMHDTEAAALPFGGLTSLVFLRDFARLKPGERVLVVGGTGAVGALAIQIGRAMGAHVAAVTSATNAGFARELGADTVWDYRETDVTRSSERFDVILDTVGAMRFADARRILNPGGRFLPLNYGLGDVLPAIWSQLVPGPRMILNVNGDRKEDLETLAAMYRQGELRPVVDTVLPFSEVVQAHRLVETRHRRGTLVLARGAND